MVTMVEVVRVVGSWTACRIYNPWLAVDAYKLQVWFCFLMAVVGLEGSLAGLID